MYQKQYTEHMVGVYAKNAVVTKLMIKPHKLVVMESHWQVTLGELV